MPVGAITNCTIVIFTLVPSAMYLREKKQARDAYVCADNEAGVYGMTFILYYMLRLVASATRLVGQELAGVCNNQNAVV